MKNTILIVAILLISLISNAQYPVVNFTTNDGLIHNTVNCISIDSQGNKWIGTQGGISKFDGTTWTNYTTINGLVNNNIRSISIDAQGNKWFGTEGGVSKFDGTTWTNYTITNGLLNNNISTIIIDAQGNKWFGTALGISKFNGTTWTNYTTVSGLVNNNVLSMAIDNQGNKWFGTTSGISKFDGTTWTNYTIVNGITIQAINCITIDLQGNKWFGSDGGKVIKFDDTNWTNLSIKNGSYPNTSILSIAIDLQGNKWVGTTAFMQGGGKHGFLSKFDDVNWEISPYNLPSNYDNYSITSIAFDLNGNKWVGTASSQITGVFYICTEMILPIVTSNGNANICQGNSVELTTDNSSSYLWSNGETTKSISVSIPGDYTVKTKDINGCPVTSSPISINIIQAIIPEICLVTNQNNKNLVVWQKSNTYKALSYKIYKQNNTTSNYELIHEQSKTELSEFLDLTSNPSSLVSRYKISYIDSCNNESPLSDNHTTILLSSNLGTNNTVNLNWNAYEGFVYSNFEIWRSLDGVNYNLLSTLANNTFSYIDVNPNTQSYYQIRITNPNGCTSSKSSFSTASSNIIDKSGHAVGLTENSLDALLSFFPNPTKGSFKITSSLDKINSIVVFDNLGKIVYSNHEISNEKDHSIDLFNSTEGIYTVKVISDSKIITSKIALQR